MLTLRGEDVSDSLGSRSWLQFLLLVCPLMGMDHPSLGLFFSSPCYKEPAELADEGLGSRTVGLNLKREWIVLTYPVLEF